MDGTGADVDDGSRSGTFLVTAAEEASAVLSAVGDGQVCTLSANPDLSVGDVVEATLAPEGPLGATWRVVDLVERWRPKIEAVDEAPGERAVTVAMDQATGDLTRVSIESGELHVVSVVVERTDDAVRDVVADETTRRVAARVGARRVEVRGAEGVVGVRYLR